MKMFRKKGGFTLAEVLIVVALLAILTAVAAPNVAKYSRSIKLRELDDSARSIFMAAEHKFINQVEMGRELPEGSEEIKTDLSRYKFVYDASDENRLHIAFLKSDNTALADLMGSADSTASPVESTGLFESELLENNYIIEYNPQTGDVYGVFYSEEDMSDYNPAAYDEYASGSGDKLIGYYGLKNVKPDSRPEGGDVPKPTVDIKNREMLVLTIQKPEAMEAHVAIRLYQPDESDATKINEIYIVKREDKVTWTTGKEITIILDTLAPDSGKTELANAKELSEKTFKDSISNWIDGSDISLDRDISVEVIFYDETGIARDETVTRTFNPLFANGSNKTEQHIAYIEYGRHLQNLDKCSTIQTAVIRKTIDFSSKADDYEGWANDDVYKGRKFECLTQHSLSKLYGSVGTEIRYLEVDGCGLFEKLSSMEISNLKFFAPNVKSTLDYAGVICGLSDKTQYKNITIVNPIVEAMEGNNSSAGSLSGALYGEDSVDGCAVYVEGSEAEWNTTIDPFSKYVIKASSNAGGLVGFIGTVEIKNSYSAVKVKGNTAGGIVGSIGSTYGEASIENSFASGHTYYGIFDGTAKDGTSVNLRDNISGKTVGGIFGTLMGYVKLSGTVFSTCSVCGTEEADTAYLDYNKVYGLAGGADVPDGSAVYTLGTAYKDNGDGTFTEIKKSADTNVKTGDQVETTPNPALRYDKKVSGQDAQYKYPLPTGMTTMRGDWPTGDESVTGFFYWEKEGGVYHIRALSYDGETPKELTVADENKICLAQDGNNVTESGYGAFCIGKELESDSVKFADKDNKDILEKFKEISSDTSGIAKILAAVADLKTTEEQVKIKLYSAQETGLGFVTATVGEKEYTFAPDFYAIYADSSTDHFGTPADTYGVRTADHLKNIGKSAYLAGSFEQSHDIVPGEITPIGDGTNPFKGTYNGGSYRILNATFNTTESSDYAGLFGVTENAKLENIVMFKEAATAADFEKISGKTVGVIVAKAGGTSGSIKNCVAAGYTLIGETAGGIAGEAGCGIENCEANIGFGKIEGASAAAGGIVGRGEGIAVKNCYALIHGIDSPKSSIALGGIAGEASTVTNCYVIFSGQISGYPVADVENNDTNYFANDDGFCSISKRYTDVGKGLHLNSGDPSLSSVKKCYENQISFIKSAKKDDTNCYELTGVVKDVIASEAEGKDVYAHYGPIPEEVDTSGGYLSNGPLAGVFNFYYSYVYSPNVYDGFMVYNKYGKVYSANYGKEAQDDLNQHKPIGVFVNKAYNASGSVKSPADYGLRIEVNGVTWENFKCLETAHLQDNSGYLFFPRDSDGRRIDHMHDTDNKPDPSNRFSFWEVDGIEPDKINSIVIYYTPEGEKEGMLLSTKRENGFDALIPKAFVDDRVPPIVGVFKVHTDSNNGKGNYARAALSNGAAIVPTINTWSDDSHKLGIVVETSRLPYDLDYIVAYHDYTPYKFTQWDDYTNKEDFEGYTLFLLDEAIFDDGSTIYNFNIEIGYGSKLIYFAKESEGIASNEPYADKEIRAKIGTVIYCKEESGDIVAKARTGGGEYIGESTGEMQDLGFIISSDISINDITITVEDEPGKTYTFRGGLNIKNKDMFNGYTLYVVEDINGNSVTKDFKLTIRYQNKIALISREF